MTITYPINMPTDVIGFASIELRAENVVAISQSPFTFRQQVFRHPGQRWSASISLEPINRDLSEPWVAFLLSLNGQAGTFLLGDPLGVHPRGNLIPDVSSISPSYTEPNLVLNFLEDFYASPNPNFVKVDENQPAQTSSLNIKGLPSSVSKVFKAGDYIQLGSAATATLHKILTDADSNGDGEASLNIWPYTRRAVVDNESITFLNPKGRFRLANNQQAWGIESNFRYGISFEVVEAL